MSTRWGIMAPGKIAHKFVGGLQRIPGAEIYAIGSRSAERAGSFARQYGAAKSYGSYIELAGDEDVDIIYIASPHPVHYENALMCLEHGKAVLCEKPFTMNLRQLRHLVDTARTNRVFLMEALWTRFLPTMEKILEVRDSGTLGSIRFINADFGFKGDYDPANRLFNPALGGGALLDIGIYPVFLAMLLLGKPPEITATSQMAETGVDASTSMIFSYADGQMANLSCTYMANTPIQADIIFEKGIVHIDPKWFCPTSIIISGEDGKEDRFQYEERGNGYQYQAIECMRCLDAGMTESPLMSLEFSLELMGTLDRIREICGIRYPDDSF